MAVTDQISETNVVKGYVHFFSWTENTVINNMEPQLSLILNELDFQTSAATWCSRKKIALKRSKHLFPGHTLSLYVGTTAFV